MYLTAVQASIVHRASSSVTATSWTLLFWFAGSCSSKTRCHPSTEPWCTYLYPFTVLIVQPQATGGRQAAANAIMQPDLDRSQNLTTGKRYLYSHLEVIEPGFGYMRQPKISFLDHPQEDSQCTMLYSHKTTPTAISNESCPPFAEAWPLSVCTHACVGICINICCVIVNKRFIHVLGCVWDFVS